MPGVFLCFRQLAAGVLLSALLSSCGFREAITYEKADNFSLQPLGSDSLLLTADAWFYNPNRQGGRLHSVDVRVWLGERQLARVVQPGKVTVPGRQRFAVPLQARLARQALEENLLGGLLDLLQGQKLEIRLEGRIRVSSWGIAQTIPLRLVHEVKR